MSIYTYVYLNYEIKFIHFIVFEPSKSSTLSILGDVPENDEPFKTATLNQKQHLHCFIMV